MKRLIMAVFLGLALTACNEKETVEVIGKDGSNGQPGTQLFLTQLTDGAQIDSSDGESVTIKDGNDGNDGMDGTQLFLQQLTDGVLIKSSDGQTAKVSNGKDGKSIVGPPGPQGPPGAPGKGDTLKVERVSNGVKITSSSGSSAILYDGNDGNNGNDGNDGNDGQDGKDAVILTEVKVKANSCTKVAKDIWVENILHNNEHVFDVYDHKDCSDFVGGKLEEACDNVIPSYGASGSVDDDYHAGSGTTCWAGTDDRTEVQGHRINKDLDIVIKLKTFN